MFSGINRGRFSAAGRTARQDDPVGGRKDLCKSLKSSALH